MEDSEIQELASSPLPIDEARKSGRLQLVLNAVYILLILWLARDWLQPVFHWLNGYSQKEIARRLGISSGVIGFLYFLVHPVWSIYIASKKKEQKKQAEEEKKQFNPRYNPIAERDSESWSHERNHD